MNLPFQGGCLCGALRYVCSAEPVFSGHCQCTDCRKDSGTGHGSHMAVPKPAVTISGEAKVFEKKADSGNTVGRGGAEKRRVTARRGRVCPPQPPPGHLAPSTWR